MIIDIETAKTKWCPMTYREGDELDDCRCIADKCMYWTYIPETGKGFCGQAPPLITRGDEVITIKTYN